MNNDGRAIAQLLERTLDILAIPTWVAQDVGHDHPRAKAFDAIEPWLSWEHLRDQDVIRTDVLPSDIGNRCRVAIAVRGSDDQPQLHAFASATMQEVRGRVIAVLPMMIRYDLAWITGSRVYSSTSIFGFTRDSTWVPLTPKILPGRARELAERIPLAFGCQLLQDTQWRVYLSRQPGIGVSLPTDARGIAAIIQSRDRDTDKGRRIALQHWVEEHWRQNRYDVDTEVKVRAHLRGASVFTWNGLSCRIKPSRLDETIKVALADERQAQHEEGIDRKLVGEDTPAWNRPMWITRLLDLRHHWQQRRKS